MFIISGVSVEDVFGPVVLGLWIKQYSMVAVPCGEKHSLHGQVMKKGKKVERTVGFSSVPHVPTT